MKRIRFVGPIMLLLIALLALSSCAGLASDWTRRDMPTNGLDFLVEYNLNGPADKPEEQKNEIIVQGVNNNAPFEYQYASFNQMSGTKRQSVVVRNEAGLKFESLGMNKPERFAGLTKYVSVEPATFSGTDKSGKTVCGVKVRMEFKRNLLMTGDPNLRDFDTIWYYDIPNCSQGGMVPQLDFSSAKLRAVVLTQVWQFRLAGSSFFFNWGHSVTSIGGTPTRMQPGWWTDWDRTGSENDVLGAIKISNDMILDLESSPNPWLEFKPEGQFAKDGSYLIYSAGDADQYATLNRALLNRQSSYVVAYRPDPQTAWDYIQIQPVYDQKWNNVSERIQSVRGTLESRLDEHGQPRTADDEIVREYSKNGFMNAPNVDLDQIRFLDRNDNVLYAMTVRAFYGASDTLIMFGNNQPDEKLLDRKVIDDKMPRPVELTDKFEPKLESEQPFTVDQWTEWQQEASLWNFLKGNPAQVGSDLFVQYRFVDNTTWAPITCTDSDGDSYTCGYNPVKWELKASYYLNGEVRKPWMVNQLLGEVGVRTMGMSFASGRFKGTGLLYGMSQKLLFDEYQSGFQPESIWRLDARASQLPDTLAEAWSILHQK